MDIKKISIMENGTLKEYDVLFTIKNEIENKLLVIYTDLNSNIDIYATSYDEKTKEIKYIDNPADQAMVEKAISIIKEKLGGEV